MLRLKKIGLLVLIFVLPALLQTCKENRYKYKYVSLDAFVPYMTKVFEENTYEFVPRNIKRLKHVLKGFRIYRKKIPITWAVERESSIIAYFSELADKTVVLRCSPFNPPGQPHQLGEIFINGNYLRKIVFKNKGQYHFTIPSNLLNYGSNHITFKWKYLRSPQDFGVNNEKRKYAVGLSYIKFQNKSQRYKSKRPKNPGKICLNRKAKVPGIEIPHGGIIEYFINLPEKSHLRFRLSSRRKYLKNSIFYAAVYSDRGEKIIRHLKSDSFHSQKVHQINLNQFAKETVKIVFANSIRNHPHLTISLISPTIYSPRESLPGFPGVESSEAGKKKIGNHKQGNIKTNPNVFVYLIDTLRADHLSCYGYGKETTPYIDRFSKTGILFTNCFATASWTKPAVGSILTGLYPNKHNSQDQKDRLSNDVEMISEVLKSHGYATIYITPNMNSSREMNFDQGIDIYRFTIGGKYGEDFYRSSEFLNSEFFEIIENNPNLLDKPLFAFLHTVDPHDPYTPKAPFLKFKKGDKERKELGFSDSIRLKKKIKGLSRKDIDYIKSLYDCEILHNDYYFGKFVDFLKEKNLYENSIIVMVADHGEQFDEHGSIFHGCSIYNEEVHVPLIIKFPYGKFSGIRTGAIVSQVDIFPTILDYLGIEISPGVDGLSIFNILNNKHFKRPVFIKEKLNRGFDKSNFVGFIDTVGKKKHIITYWNELFINASDFELYDLEKDFAEKTDIFEKENIFSVKAIKFIADYFLEKMKSPGFKEEKKLDLKKLDPEKLKQLKTLGYLN
jgi:arylsulfatase A-like enzyme